KPNLVVSSGYQVCWEKFCVYWDIEMRLVPMDEEHMSLNIDKVLDYVDDYTIGVVALQGITYTGKFDDIKALDALLEEYNKTAKISVPIHV
ncbi:pyridoxal-dependent decarboxylase, partial [Paraclostridium sordellii]